MTLKEAKELSILKWTIIVEQFGICDDHVMDHPQLAPLSHFCGFCEIYNKNFASECRSCEFGKVAGICSVDNGESLYHNWFCTRGSNKLTAAQKILDVIKSIEIE